MAIKEGPFMRINSTGDVWKFGAFFYTGIDLNTEIDVEEQWATRIFFKVETSAQNNHFRTKYNLETCNPVTDENGDPISVEIFSNEGTYFGPDDPFIRELRESITKRDFPDKTYEEVTRLINYRVGTTKCDSGLEEYENPNSSVMSYNYLPKYPNEPSFVVVTYFDVVGKTFKFPDADGTEHVWKIVAANLVEPTFSGGVIPPEVNQGEEPLTDETATNNQNFLEVYVVELL